METIESPVGIEKLSPVLGAKICGIDLRRPLDNAAVRAIREAFVRDSVLCFPDQKITPQDQVRFAALFGQADVNYRPRSGLGEAAARARGVMLVSNIRKNGQPIGSLPDGEMHFHSDGAHRESPYRATTLYAIKVPSRGGETMFANLYAAYEALSESMKARLEGLTGRNMYDYDSTIRGTAGDDEDDLSVAIHSLVRVHPESGRRALFLSRLMTRTVVGMRARQNVSSSRLFEAVILGMIIPPDTQNQPWRKDRIRNAANNRVTNGRLR